MTCTFVLCQAYGSIGMACDGKHDGVHHFEFRVVKLEFIIIIGIDEGREYVDDEYYGSHSQHYGLQESGELWMKGTFHFTLQSIQSKMNVLFDCVST